jgi:predicted O-methyltransferase YrrM
MNKAEELHKKIVYVSSTERMRHRIAGIASVLDEVHDGARGYKWEMESVFPGYYEYLAAATKILKPSIIVELGADRGASALAFSSELKEGKIFSCDIREDAWEYIAPGNKRVVKVCGDYMDLSIWGDTDLLKTDLWLIDGEHGEDHVKKQMDLYNKFFKKDAVLIFDDIKSYYKALNKFSWDKYYSVEAHGNHLLIAIV